MAGVRGRDGAHLSSRHLATSNAALRPTCSLRAHPTSPLQSACHLDFTAGRSHTLSAHHLYRVTERSTLAAKFIADTRSLNSMAAAGYRLRFRNTATTVTGEVDTYGKVRVLLEREPVKDLRVALSGEVVTAAAGGPSTFGLQVSVGPQAALPRQVSPITITRDVFNPY